MNQYFFRSVFDCSEGAEDQPHDAENVGRAMEEACSTRALAIPLGLCDVCVCVCGLSAPLTTVSFFPQTLVGRWRFLVGCR